MKKTKITILCAIILMLTTSCFKKDNDELSSKFFEDLNYEIIDSKKLNSIDVVIRPSYIDNDISMYKNKKFDTLKESQDNRSELLKSNKEYYTKMNEEYISANNLNKLEYTYSEYSPFVLKSYETVDEYLLDKSQLLDIAKKSTTKEIFVETKQKISQDTLEDYDDEKDNITDWVDMDGIKDMVDIDNTEYTGDGIKIGFLEHHIENNNINFTNNRIININESSDEIVNVSTGDQGEHLYDHSVLVSTIAAGNEGIASSAKLYYVKLEYINNSLEQNINVIDRFLDNKVNIINISKYIDDEEGIHSGQYNSTCYILDYLSQINQVVFVKSAGNYNEEDNNKYITNPGAAMNILTVGSVNNDKELTNYSKYELTSDYSNILLKPNLVAPGSVRIPNTYSANENDNFGIGGTSFAAPVVTGVLALLMEEFNSEITDPFIYITALMNSATKVSGSDEMHENETGFGVVNYHNARQILLDEANYNIYNGQKNITTDSYELILSNQINLYDSASNKFVIQIFGKFDNYMSYLKDSQDTYINYEGVEPFDIFYTFKYEIKYKNGSSYSYTFDYKYTYYYEFELDNYSDEILEINVSMSIKSNATNQTIEERCEDIIIVFTNYKTFLGDVVGYEQFDEINHKMIYANGFTNTERHTFTTTALGKRVCTKCGYISKNKFNPIIK